eukprot:SAG31_NODE_31062_length_372_cov_2.443223_1_plen_90_part_10
MMKAIVFTVPLLRKSLPLVNRGQPRDDKIIFSRYVPELAGKFFLQPLLVRQFDDGAANQCGIVRNGVRIAIKILGVTNAARMQQHLWASK